MKGKEIVQNSRYQFGDSDTELKITQAGFPKDMEGDRFLDLGCNAGAFLDMAKERGALLAVGVEKDEDFAELAIHKSVGDIIKGDWNTAPWDLDPANGCWGYDADHWDLGAANGCWGYDTIIWLSASHYEPAPRRIFERIEKSLAPGGLFIWEGGIADGHTKSFSRLPRPDAPDRYPTKPMLEDLLSCFSFRLHGPSTSLENQGNRVFYHCWKKKPKVVIIKGESRTGKTEMARLFENAVVLDFDRYACELEIASKHGGTTDYIKAIANYDMPLVSTQKRLESYLRERNLIMDMVKDYTWPVTQDNDVYVLEGGMLGLIKEEIKEWLGTSFRIWDMDSRG